MGTENVSSNIEFSFDLPSEKQCREMLKEMGFKTVEAFQKEWNSYMDKVQKAAEKDALEDGYELEEDVTADKFPVIDGKFTEKTILAIDEYYFTEFQQQVQEDLGYLSDEIEDDMVV